MKLSQGQNMDTLGFEPRAFRMRSGCDTTTPCALGDCVVPSRGACVTASRRGPSRSWSQCSAAVARCQGAERITGGARAKASHTPGQDRTGDLQRVRLTS